jgi:predicted MFS family arabinose efflux permease
MGRPVFLIVLAELLGTSVWFTGNAAAADLKRAWGISDSGVGWLVVAVQLGFICGTLVLALTGVADRFRASHLFAACAFAAAATNAGLAAATDLEAGVALRFLTGLALAGVYPVGMKLVVGWAPGSAGTALGWLVGALTLGTATPHLVRGLGSGWDWQAVVLTSSVLATAGGVIVLALGTGPHLPARSPGRPAGIAGVFRRPDFRASALGYFGHMWELYAFWAVVPALIESVLGSGGPTPSLWSFGVIAAGAVGCVSGGLATRRHGSAAVAAASLAGSAAAGALFPLAARLPAWVSLGVLVVWGFAVVADSPQFSAMSARTCPRDAVGAALALQNGIGFLITVAAIAVVSNVDLGVWVAWLLVPGPVLGLLGMRRLLRQEQRGTVGA